MLIILGGLPATGKTTLARHLARRLAGAHLRIDTIEHALAVSCLRIHPAEDAGYQVGYALAFDNLALGRTVIADSVNPIALTRAAWRAVAERVGCPSVEIEVVCSDIAEHRRRVENRQPDTTGLLLPTWDDICSREYEPWSGSTPRVVDTAGRGVDACVAEILLAVTDRMPAAGSGGGDPRTEMTA